MFIDHPKNTIKGKVYTRILLRNSYRDENGKVKHQTLLNLTNHPKEEIQAIEFALKHKHNLDDLKLSLDNPLHIRQGFSYGALYLLHQLAQRIGLVDALGSDRQGQLALWQVLSRALNQGSRLGAARLAKNHAIGEILGLDSFNEDHLYENLTWLAEHQTAIEKALFEKIYGQNSPNLYLYDVTSSYLEGTCNELAAWGYNRDGKRGKQQIVVGLLCDQSGNALSIEVFKGNTQDTQTFGQQILKVAERFGGKEVTLVGDRGMIKGPQIKELGSKNFHYITAITKPQIESLLQSKVLQMELFDDRLAEVEDTAQKVRYVLRRNPVRMQEMRQTRQSQWAAIQKAVAEKNQYLTQHPKAKVTVAVREITGQIQSFKAKEWAELTFTGRSLTVTKNEAQWEEAQKLDGCYAIKTDLKKELATMEVLHNRYKDLSLVEQGFRTMKTVELEIRPVYVQLEDHTRAHALVAMLAYRLIKELEKSWCQEDLTVEEGLKQLDTFCLMELIVNDQVAGTIIPDPQEQIQHLLNLANVQLPKRPNNRKVKVSTKNKLQNHRPRRSK